MWERLSSDLSAQLADDEELSILLGNFECDKLLDALFISRRGVCIVELKSHSGALVAEANAAWTIDGRAVGAGGELNPLRQVRQMRFSVQNRMEAWWRIHRPDLAPPDWRRGFKGRVVFNDPLSLEDYLDEATRAWFGIKTISDISSSLGRLRSTGFNIDDELVDALAKGVLRPASAARRYGRGIQSESARDPGRPRILYCESEKQFNNSRRALIQRQGDAQIAHGIIESILGKVRKGLDPLRDIPFTERNEVHGLRVHSVSAEHRLLVIHIDGKNYLVIVGKDSEIEEWIRVNAGATFAVDLGNARLTRTQVDVPRTDAETVMTTENKPFLERVAEDIVRAEIPDEYLEKVSSIDEDTSPEEREEALAEIMDPDLRAMLRDVLELARTGREEAAKARVKLYSGDAVPLQDAPELHEAALESMENSDVLVDLSTTDEADFVKIMDAVEDEKWMWFLHPGQERVVVENFPNPCVLTGVSGSGKTSVLLHRARRLAAKHQDQEILVLTLNESLARMIHSNLVRFCSPDEASRIKSLSFHGYLRKLLRKTDAKEFLKEFGEQTRQEEAINDLINGGDAGDLNDIFEALEPGELKELFRDFCLQLKGGDRVDFNNLEVFLYSQDQNLDPIEYLFDEMELLRSAFPCRGDYEGYLVEFSRQGRAISFQRNRKEQVLRLLRLWEEFQIRKSFLDHMGLVQAAFIAHENLGGIPEDLKFRCVLVDEFQDFSNLEMKIISAIPTQAENGLFLTGDYAQKLYARQLSLDDAGLSSRSNRRILKNYRNTRQILTAAQCLIDAFPMPVDKNAKDGVELLKPEYAFKEGSKPTAYLSRNTILAAWRDIAEAVSSGLPSPSLCILTADTEVYPVDDIINCRPAGLNAQDIADWGSDGAQGVVVSDINSIKGFEFRRIFIVGMEEGAYPPKGHFAKEHWRDAQRLYVAITRGREEVRFYYEGKPSSFLLSMGNAIEFSKELEAPKVSIGGFPREGTVIEKTQADTRREVVADDHAGNGHAPDPCREAVVSDPGTEEALEVTGDHPVRTGRDFDIPRNETITSDAPLRFGRDFFNSSYINGENLIVFFRRPNQRELARALRVRENHVQNLLMDNHRLGLVPHNPLEKHLVLSLCQALGFRAEIREESAQILPLADIPPDSKEAEEIRINHEEADNVTPDGEELTIPDNGLEIAELRIKPLKEKRRELKYLFSGETDYADIAVYPVEGPDGFRIELHLLKFENGDRQITCGENLSGKRVWERLVYRLRKGIEPLDEGKPEGILFMDLRQARFTRGEWSGRFVAEKAALDKGAGVDVYKTLFNVGAIDCGTKEKVLGEINRTRAWPCVSFAAKNEKAPLAAYVLTTILPLMNGMAR